MILVRCAWHRPYRRLLRVAQWWPLWRLEWSDGICKRCRTRLAEEHQRRRSAEHPVVRATLASAPSRQALQRSIFDLFFLDQPGDGEGKFRRARAIIATAPASERQALRSYLGSVRAVFVGSRLDDGEGRVT